MYRSLKSTRIIATIEELHCRIQERFPKANLIKVCEELLSLSQQSQERIAFIQKPNYRLRFIIFVLILVILYGIYYISPTNVDKINNLSDFIQILGASSEALTFLVVSSVFIVTFEQRLKKNKALKALHELRSIAHVVDMHQLTKDPNKVMKGLILTKSSPKVDMDSYQLIRYLNYCSEMLSLIGKIAALYGEHLQDSSSIATVNEIEDLTTGLSRKIWQKIIILNKLTETD